MSKLQCTIKAKNQVLMRPRLFNALDHARLAPLTWVHAPAGSGKSTLVTHYLETQKLHSLWYTCNDEDNQLPSFFYNLGEFHRQLYLLQSRKLPQLQAKQQSTVLAFGQVFFHKLFSNLSDSSVLVFDDFHCIENNSLLHKILRNSLTYLPKNLSIIVISRHQPLPVYARLHAVNKITEIPAKEIMFTPQETENFVQLMVQKDKQIELNLLDNWYNKTQGWVTGLLLLLEQTRNDRSFYIVDDEAVQEHVFEYFSSEYFDYLKQTTKEFLVITNLLTSFSSCQARELTENSKARQILHDMVSCQFITFQREDSQTIYQFHPLLHEFLLAHLCELYSNAEIVVFKNKAARLLAEAGQLNHAIALYQQTESYHALSQLLLKYADKVYKKGEFEDLESWVLNLPKIIIAQEPWLAYWVGMVKIHSNPVVAKPFFEMAINRFIQIDDAKGAYLSWVGIATSYVLVAHTFKGATEWIELLNDFRGRWPSFPDMETQIQVTFSALNLLAQTSVDHEEISEWVVRSEKLYQFIPRQTLGIAINLGLVNHNNFAVKVKKIKKLAIENYKIVMDQNAPSLERVIACTGIVSSACITPLPDVINTLAVLDKGLKIAEKTGVHCMNSIILAQGIQLLLQANEIEKAKQYLNKLGQTIAQTGHFISRANYYVIASHIEAEQGNHPTALIYLIDAVEIVEEHAAESVHELFFRAALALQLNEMQKYDEATQQLKKVEKLSLQLKSWLSDFMIIYIKARTAYLQKKGSEAKRLLNDAFHIGRRKKINGLIFWRPSIMRELLKFALEEGIEIAYVDKQIGQLRQFGETTGLTRMKNSA